MIFEHIDWMLFFTVNMKPHAVIVYKRVKATLADESVRPPTETSRERQLEPGITLGRERG